MFQTAFSTLNIRTDIQFLLMTLKSRFNKFWREFEILICYHKNRNFGHNNSTNPQPSHNTQTYDPSSRLLQTISNIIFKFQIPPTSMRVGGGVLLGCHVRCAGHRADKKNFIGLFSVYFRVGPVYYNRHT